MNYFLTEIVRFPLSDFVLKNIRNRNVPRAVHGDDLLMLDYFHGMIVFRFVDFLIAWKFYKHLAEKGMG